MDILVITGLVLIVAVISVTIKRYAPEYSVMINIMAGIVVLSAILLKLLPAISEIKGLLSAAKIPGQYGTILFKTLGICLIAQFASDSCIDAGEKALSSRVELAGRIAIVVTALPLFEDIARTAVKLMGG